MPERRDSGEGLHDVLSLPQQLSNCRSTVRAEATSRHARCLPVSRGCRHGEVDSGEARSTTSRYLDLDLLDPVKPVLVLTRSS